MRLVRLLAGLMSLAFVVLLANGCVLFSEIHHHGTDEQRISELEERVDHLQGIIEEYEMRHERHREKGRHDADRREHMEREHMERMKREHMERMKREHMERRKREMEERREKEERFNEERRERREREEERERRKDRERDRN